MDQVLTFDKSLQQRLQEYTDVLSGYEVLPVSCIAKEWGFYLELAMDPSGWQAVWKIPRVTCENLNIPFPSIVLVFVLETDLKDLVALVNILAVQDEIHIPEKHYVPLIQLWPTKDQDKTVALNLNSTANALDMLRFFYTKIFMPWDHEDDDSTDWLAKHLESRLRLYYDVKNGMIPRPIAEHLHSSLSEARRLQTKRDILESELVDSEIDIDESPDNEGVQKLMQIHLRMMKIKNEVEILENPLLRAAVIRQQKECELTNKAPEVKQQVWLIHEEAKIDEFITFLEEVKTHFPDAAVKFASELATTLETSNSNDVYVLNKTSHYIRTVGALENGGVMKGIATKSDTIVFSDIEDVMLDFKGDNVVLENLTIDVSAASCGILVRRGKLRISNCKIIGDGKSSTHQGLIVLASGEVEIIDSEFCGFSTAIVGNSGSKITLTGTEIFNVTFGLKIFDRCNLSAKKTTFRDCKNYGILVETDHSLDGDEQRTGDFDLLSIIPDVNTECVRGLNNAKGDVAINQKSKIKALEDVFSDPSVNATLCCYNQPSDEDMEVTEVSEMNATVVQIERPISPLTI